MIVNSKCFCSVIKFFILRYFAIVLQIYTFYFICARKCVEKKLRLTLLNDKYLLYRERYRSLYNVNNRGMVYDEKKNI